MPHAYSRTKRGAKKVVDESSTVYEVNKISSKTVSWQCEKPYQGCKATINTSFESFVTDLLIYFIEHPLAVSIPMIVLR